MSITDRIKNAFNAFNSAEDKFAQNVNQYTSYGASSYAPQYKLRGRGYTKGSIIDTIASRIANDVSMIDIKHIKRDKDPKTEEIQNSGLERCLSIESNVDQSAIDFKKDIVFSMMDEGVIAVVPVVTDVDPEDTNSYEILSMRVGKITAWYPQHVKVRLYDEQDGQEKELILSKRKVAIIENPLFEIMNAENSTLKRLRRKLQLNDILDDSMVNKKLDLLIQLPYAVKGDVRQAQAQKRVEDIQEQLSNSKLGIAYIDSTEHVTQLNRSVENNLTKEIEYLETMLFNQLGLTKAIFDGTAGEQELRSYYDRTIKPFAARIALEFSRKFLTDTARTQGHDIVYYQDPFKLVSISNVATMADTFRRNYILSANEIREIIGFQPSDDERADELFNPNIADANQMVGQPAAGGTEQTQEPVDPEQKELATEILKESVL